MPEAGEPFFFTWSAQNAALPIEITGGQGGRFTTADGASWIDLGSMVWNANLGHGHPDMRAALTAAAERNLLAQPSSIFPEKRAAARALLGIAPAGLRDGKVFFCSSGAEANENAVKMALLATGRSKIIHRDCSYHGATLAMLSISGDPRRAPFAAAEAPLGIEFSDPYAATPCPGDLETVIAAHGPDQIAAVILEGVVGANGVRVPPPGYFRRVRDLCDHHGILFIADEVLSGFGRTGAWFAVDHDGVSPDFLTCAKGLTGGYAPGGAVVVAPGVARHFDDRVLSCGLTTYAHPLTCAAITAAIDAYQRDDLPERARRLGVLVESRLHALANARSFIAQPRGLGLLWALDLLEPGTHEPANAARMQKLAAALRAQHVHLHKRDHMIFIAPPLVIAESDLDQGLARVSNAIDEVFT